MGSFISHGLSCTSVFWPGRFLVSRAFSGFQNVVHRDPIHSGGLQGPRPDPTLLEPLRHRLEFSGHAPESPHRLFRIPLRWHCQVRALVADVDPRRVRMYYLQTDIVGLDLPRPLTALFSTHALPLAGRATRSCLCLLRLSFPGGFHAMLSLLFEIAARPGRRKLHNLPSGVEPWSFFKDNAATIFTIAKHRSHADLRAVTHH